MDSSNTTDSIRHRSASSFLFQSRQYTKSMEGLKDSIDNSQGLAVLIGESGAGKSTLCRELHKEYINDDRTESLLLLDPHFDSTADFISALAGLFGSLEREAGTADNQYKENVKKFLFDQAIASKKNILILINKVDTLPDFYLRTLEELYKYHIDAHRFLQVILAGSKKVQKQLSAFHDLSTYVSKYHTLGPMSFQEAKEIIRRQISDETQSKPDRTTFSLAAQWVIFKNAQGYPGRIKDLCQLIFMTLSLHNTNKANWHIAQICAKMLLPEQAVKLQRLRFSVIAVILTVTVVYGISMQSMQETPPRTPPQPAPSQQSEMTTPVPSVSITEGEHQPDSTKQVAVELPPESTPPVEQETIQKLAVKVTPPAMKTEVQEEHIAVPAPQKKPEVTIIVEHPPAEIAMDTGDEYPSSITGIQPTTILGEITVREQETLWDMIRKLYGPHSFNHQNTKTVLMINPAIEELHHISIGDIIKFPAIPVELTKEAENLWWLEFATFNDIASAYRFLKDHANTPPMLIIPKIIKDRTMQFAVIMQENFTKKNDAVKAKRLLTPAIFPEVTLLVGLPEERYYYVKKDHLETPSKPTATAPEPTVTQP